MNIKDTKFYKWLSYSQPYVLTLEEWGKFDDEFKRKAPIRYFFFVYLVRKIESIFGFYGVINNWYWKIKYRTVKKYHIINTGLKPNYYDKDTILLHGCFSLLVDYVEKECAHMHYCAEQYDGTGVLTWAKKPWFIKAFLRRFKHPKRSREHGIEHLKWAATLDSTSRPRFDRAYGQAEAARKTIELYTWWKDIRPNRKYPDDPAKDVSIGDIIHGRLQKEDPELYEKHKKYMNTLDRLDREWEEEDDEMLAKLIAIRKELWT